MGLVDSVIVDPSLAVPVTPSAPRRSSPAGPVTHLAGPRGIGQAMKRSASAIDRSYSAANSNRLNRDWITAHYSGDSAIAASWDSLTRRARDLVRNEPWAKQAVERIVQNVVGDEGIRTEAEIELDDETLDDETNQQIDEGFARWADEADAEGEMHWAEIQALVMSEAPEVGESFLVRVSDPSPSRFLPLAYQIMEAEQINDTLDRPRGSSQNQIKRGIEYNAFGRAVAYHFWAEHPYDLQVSSMDTIRVPAERVIHYFARRRPSQRRGVTWFAPILQSLRDMSEYMGDEMTAARIASYFTVAIKRAAGAGTGLGFSVDGESSEEDDDGNPLESLGPGIIADIGADDEVTPIYANRPNSQAEPWIRLMLHSMANGIGMTYIGLTGDVERANFSSARFARLGDKLFWRTLQGRFGRRVVLRVRQEVVSQLVALGRIRSLTPGQLAGNRYRLLATRLLPPGWEEVQVKEEVEAAILRIQGGLSTLQEECAGRGKNWRRVLKQRAREVALAESLEVPVGANVLPGKAAGPQPTDDQQQDQSQGAR